MSDLKQLYYFYLTAPIQEGDKWRVKFCHESSLDNNYESLNMRFKDEQIIGVFGIHCTEDERIMFYEIVTTDLYTSEDILTDDPDNVAENIYSEAESNFGPLRVTQILH